MRRVPDLQDESPIDDAVGAFEVAMRAEVLLQIHHPLGEATQCTLGESEQRRAEQSKERRGAERGTNSLEGAELAGARGSRIRQTGEGRGRGRGRGQAKAKGRTDLHDVLHEGELEHPVEMQRLVFENVLDANEKESILSLVSASASSSLFCIHNPHNSSEQ